MAVGLQIVIGTTWLWLAMVSTQKKTHQMNKKPQNPTKARLLKKYCEMRRIVGKWGEEGDDMSFV